MSAFHSFPASVSTRAAASARERKAAHPRNPVSWQVPLRTLTKNQKRGYAACMTRDAPPYSVFRRKVSGFATKPNTLLRVFCPLPHGGAHGVRALPVGRDMRSHPVASSRWPVAARRRARDAHPTKRVYYSKFFCLVTYQNLPCRVSSIRIFPATVEI